MLARLLDPPAGEIRSNYGIAFAYLGLGNRDQAFAWLEKGFESRDEDMLFLKVDRAWVPWRSDPRYQSLLGRMGMRGDL